MPSEPQHPPEPATCPLCGRANACAMERQRLTGQVQPPCWCAQVDFARELLDRVPAAARGAACICRTCATATASAATAK